MTRYLFYKLYSALRTPLIYVAACIFNLAVCVNFFFFQKFFGGAGTTDLHYFFQAIPVFAAIVIPVLKLNENESSIDNSIPLGIIKKEVVRFLSVYLQFLLILLPLMLLPLCVNLFGNVEAGQCFTGFSVLFLYSAVCVVICILIFENIKLKASATIVSILTLFVLNILNYFSVYAGSNSVLQSLINFLSLYRHFDAAQKGIFDTRDIIYYLSVFLFFFSLHCISVLTKTGKKFSKREKRMLFYTALTIIFINLDSMRFYGRLDLTKSNKYSLSKYSKNLTKELSENLRITYFRSPELADFYPQIRDIPDILQEYSAKKNVSFKMHNASRKENSDFLERFGIYARQLPVIGNNKTEYLNVYSAVLIEYEDKTEVIPFIISADTLEYDVDTRILNLLSSKKRIVNVLVANGMSLENDYSYINPWFNSNEIIVNEINCEKEISAQLEKYSPLLVFGSSVLTESQCAEIDEFLKNDGKAFLAVSPYEADIENSWNITKSENQELIKLLSDYGFSFSGNLLADLSCSRILLQSNQNADGSPSDSVYNQQINYPLWIQILPQKNAGQGLTAYWLSEILSSDKIKPYLYSSQLGWKIEPDSVSPQKLFETNPLVLNEKKLSDEKTTIPLVYSNLDNNIILLPDQYFANSLMLGYTGGENGDYRNLDFLTNIVLRLNGEDELADIQSHSTLSKNLSFYKTYNQELFYSAKNRTLFTMFILVPLLIIAAGVAFNFNRNKILKGAIEKCQKNA